MKTVKKTPWDRNSEPEEYDKYDVIIRFIEKENYLSAKDISDFIGITEQAIRLRIKKYKKLSVLRFEEVDLYDVRNNLKPGVIDTTCIKDLKLDNEVQQFVDCLDSEKDSYTRITNYKDIEKVSKTRFNDFEIDNLDIEKVSKTRFNDFEIDNLDIEKVSKTRFNDFEIDNLDSKKGINTRRVYFEKGTIHYIELPRKGNKKPTEYYSPNFLDWFQLNTAQTFTLEQKSKVYAAMLLKDYVMSEMIKELQSGRIGCQNSRAELDTQNNIYAKKLSAENKELKNRNEELQGKLYVLKGLVKKMYTDLDIFVKKDEIFN